jgi:hypothetical protein
MNHKDRKITPPDLRKDRQLAMSKELLKPKYSVHGFKTADLKSVPVSRDADGHYQ